MNNTPRHPQRAAAFRDVTKHICKRNYEFKKVWLKNRHLPQTPRGIWKHTGHSEMVPVPTWGRTWSHIVATAANDAIAARTPRELARAEEVVGAPPPPPPPPPVAAGAVTVLQLLSSHSEHSNDSYLSLSS